MMRAVLIRHAATAGNIEKRYIGVTDESICPEGIAELCESYPEVKTVICSPMKRCLETAKLIYPSHEPVVYDDMRECDFGSFEGKNSTEIPDIRNGSTAAGSRPFRAVRTRSRSGSAAAVHSCRQPKSMTMQRSSYTAALLWL